MHLATLYNPQIVEPIANYTGSQYINRIVPILIYIGIILCAIAFIILLIYGGVRYISSGGDKVKLEGARSTIGNSITGIIILLLLWFILQVINVIFGIDIGDIGVPIHPPIPTNVPTVTVPTPTSPPGDCYCDLGVVLNDNCNPPYIAECIGQFGCHCVLPGVATPTPGGGVGSPCTSGSQCLSGLCGQDMDGDTYPGSGPGLCLATGTAMDCNDNNNLVHPGQTQYFQTSISGSNYDYDCNGANDKWPRLNCLSAPPHTTSCSITPLPEDVIRPLTGWRDFIPDCGATLLNPYQPFYLCTASHTTTCTIYPGICESFSCFDICLTGNQCGQYQDQPCASWLMLNWSPYSSYLDGVTRMPCR